MARMCTVRHLESQVDGTPAVLLWPIAHARAQVARVTRRRPAREGARRVGRLRGHQLAGARTRTHSRHNDHLWRATGRGSAAGPPRPRPQPAFDSAEANPLDTQTLKDFLMVGAMGHTAMTALSMTKFSKSKKYPHYNRIQKGSGIQKGFQDPKLIMQLMCTFCSIND